MSIKICSYNIEWFDKFFDKDNHLKPFNSDSKEDKKMKARLDGLVTVFKKIDADIYGITEAPNTTTTTGHQSAIEKFKSFFEYADISGYDFAIGFPSAGRQEIVTVYKPEKLEVRHNAGGRPDSKSNPRFDGEFYFDTDDDRIKEVYKMYRPPLEVEVKIKGTDNEFELIVVHAKSKGIFSSMDMLNWDRENKRNRKKLFAECQWVRNRVEERLKENKNVIVMGDLNDGPGMDYYEFQFGKSAVEIIMGDIFEPEKVLRNYMGKPKWKNFGWSPSSTRFKDKMTGDPINAIIDHILMSKDVAYVADSHQVLNPYEQKDLDEDLKESLKKASDHFPIIAEIF